MNSTNDWDWDLLSQEIDYYSDAVMCGTSHQFPWTNLAYLLHLIGAERLAAEYLRKSYELAAPGPNHPGDSHRKVARAIRSNCFLTGGVITRPMKPNWFIDRYHELLFHKS